MLNAHFFKVIFTERGNPANNGINNGIMVMARPPPSTLGEAPDEKLICNK
jgi:hypothetical protein